MALQKRLVVVGLAKQTAKGSPAANPAFQTGVTDGKPVNLDIDEEVIEVTSEKPLFGDADRKLVVPGMEYEALVHPKTIGLLLYGALGAVSTTGSGPYTHVITPAMDVPYLTAFGKMFGADWAKVEDAKVDELEITFEGAGSLRVSVTIMGCKFTWLTSAPTPGSDESFGATLFRSAGGTFKFSPASGTPVAANIVEGTLTISNNVEEVPAAGSVRPADVMPGVKAIEIAQKVVPDNLTDLRAQITGSGSGTELSNVPVYGSMEWTFVVDANTDLKIESPRVKGFADIPDADPSGGPVEIDFDGEALQPLTGHALTATLKNDQATY